MTSEIETEVRRRMDEVGVTTDDAIERALVEVTVAEQAWMASIRRLTTRLDIASREQLTPSEYREKIYLP